ncbi:MAG TPA: dihydrofolate reductase [Opitutus sp.]|nr:dihydrofolate reductase [Opitutus sp.]
MQALNLIVACAENRVIGRDGKLPWRIPEDWRFFKSRTAGATVILGRISFESWKSILDDDRHAIVLTRDASLARDRVQTARSLPEAIAHAQESSRPIYICGGQRIFEEAIAHPQATRLYLTLVHANVEGDRYFPEWRAHFPRVIEARPGADENFRYTFYTLARADA